MSSKLIACVVLLSLAVAVPASAETIMIDDFNSTTLNANWVESRVLDQGSSATIAYDTSTNPGVLTYSQSGYDSKVVQSVLLRKDVGLGVGETLVVDTANVSNWTQPPTGASGEESWGGLVIAMDTGISGVRKNYVYIGYYLKGGSSTGKINAYYFHNTDTTTLEYDTYIGSPLTGSVEHLFITQTSEGTYDVGYYVTGDAERTVLKSGIVADAGYELGNAIGVFNDVRYNGQVMYDNFRKEVVPEPSTLVLLACGLFGLLAYAWKKQK